MGDARISVVCQMQMQGAPRQIGAEPLGPFDQRNGLRESLVEAELQGVVGRLQAIEVEMPDRRVGHVVGLYQGEGRTRHVAQRVGLPRQRGARGDEGAGESGLAGAERAMQGDHVAGPRARGERARQVRRGG